MIVNIIYDAEQHALSEMLNTVPTDLLMRRLSVYLKNRFQNYANEIDEALENAEVYGVDIEVTFNTRLGKIMCDDPGFRDGVEAFCESMGYICNGFYDPANMFLSIQKTKYRQKDL